jgi:two-component system, LuxR family, sensor kinase FixL
MGDMNHPDHLGPRPTRPVGVNIEVRKSLSEFYTVFNKHRNAVMTATATAIGRLPPGAVAHLHLTSHTLERQAVFNAEWDPFLDHLRKIGAAYADEGESFRQVQENEFSWATHAIPMLVDAYRANPARLTAALRGQHEFIQMTLPFVAAGYYDRLTTTVRRLAAVVEATDDPVFSIDGEGRVNTWNSGASGVYGYSASQILGQSARLLSPPDCPDNSETLLARVCALEDVLRLETVHTTASGRPIQVALTASPIRAEGTIEGVAVIARDVTAQRKAQAELTQLNLDLDQFVDIVSHDLRAPLSAIANLAGWIEEDLPGAGLDPEVSENIGLLRARVDRMSALVGDLLNYSRLSRAHAEVVSVDTHILARDVIDLLGVEADFQIEIHGPLPKVFAPRAPFEHVFLNLVSNAIQHHDGTGGHIELSCERDGPNWVFTVADDGPGIDPRHHEDVFEMLKTVHSGRNERGTGMGLAIVQRIVRAHGGKVWIESRSGEGAAFRFTWPVTPPAQ